MKRKILILDIIKKGNRDSSYLAKFIEGQGFSVSRPEDIRQFVKSLSFPKDLPDAILYLHPSEEPFFKDLISAFDFYHVPIFNSPESIKNASDRLWLKLKLLDANLPTPRFYYGHPHNFRESWEGKILKLRNGEDNLVMLVDKSIHAQDKLVFLEELIRLPKGYVDSVFVVGEEIFQFAKNDSLGLYPHQDLDGEKQLEPRLADLAKKIGPLTGLAFYSVDFVDGRIIDVNAFPNIFLDRCFPAIADFLGRSLG